MHDAAYDAEPTDRLYARESYYWRAATSVLWNSARHNSAFDRTVGPHALAAAAHGERYAEKG